VPSHYTVPIGADLQQVVRKFYLDGAGVPTPGLTVPYIVRDSAGNEIQSGDLCDLAIAPGWYQLMAPLEVTLGGIYTVQYAPPVGFDPDADTIFVTSELGRATTQFVKGG